MGLFTTPHAILRGAQLRVSRVWLACVVSLAALPSIGHAQSAQVSAATSSAEMRADPQQVAMARALFEEGLRHVDAEEWALAADRFGRVIELRYSPVAAYNLALARSHLGHSVLALEGLRELLAQPNLEANVRDVALPLQKELTAQVGWLTVMLRGDCRGCTVQLDGKPLPQAALGVAVPVDPGSHALRLLRADQAVATRDLTMARGARLEVRLEPANGVVHAAISSEAADPSEPEAVSGGEAALVPAPSGALQDSPPPDDKRSLFKSPWFWGGVGVLAAGVVTLGVVLAGSGTETQPPVPGDFSPRVISGEVKP